ncbi:MAG: gldH [Sphingobacteriaceae bacterium]|jgi:gliding motility-associated lipoprotein GldH|nr:gldH [Sphingobacteriaceae bacterium]
MLKHLVKYGFVALALLIASCNDNAVVDTNQVVSGYKWSYINKIKIPVKIEDNSKAYKLFLNLRHTADYKYSNIFVLIHQSGPGMKPETIRKEFQLAYPDGEWLGKGSGDLYTYQLPFKENYKFPATGTYTFSFEQNMRDNPLQEISDVGMRVEAME